MKIKAKELLKSNNMPRKALACSQTNYNDDVMNSVHWIQHAKYWSECRNKAKLHEGTQLPVTISQELLDVETWNQRRLKEERLQYWARGINRTILIKRKNYRHLKTSVTIAQKPQYIELWNER